MSQNVGEANEVQSSLSWRAVDWRPMSIAPLGIAACVLLSRFDGFFQDLQGQLEAPAPFLIGAASAAYFVHVALRRDPLHLVLAVLTGAMALREARTWPGLAFMGGGIYVAAGAVAAWAAFWRRRLRASLLADPRHASWLLATFLAYVLAILIARRVFRFIPGEHHIHRSLEECAETIAHLMFIVTSLLASWRGKGTSGSTEGS